MTDQTDVAVDENGNSYDRIPYPSNPFPATHPDHLYTIARLFDHAAVKPSDARVLEIGCASGGNLIPMACAIPSAEFVGIDLSSVHIAQAQETVKQLDLDNAKFHVQNVMDIPDDIGEFDYILCHGVFSWVPPNVQEKILNVCGKLLSEKGVAYISYNTFPGWFMRSMIREMMLHHVRELTEPTNKIRQARALLAFLAESTADQQTPYAKFVKQELELLSKQSDAYLFHEHLEENNLPCFFHDFMRRATGHGLQYLGEANLPSMWLGNLPAKATETLTRLTNDILQREQYADFVTNRMFRQTLLCKSGQAINRNLNDQRLNGAYFSTWVQNAESGKEIDINPSVASSFKTQTGRTIQTTDTVTKLVLVRLTNQWPASVSFEQLLQGALPLLGKVSDSQKAGELKVQVGNVLAQLVVRGIVSVSYAGDRFTREIAVNPKVSALTRWQASQGKPLTNLRHQMVQVDNVMRLVIDKIDGTRSVEQLIDAAQEMAAEGKLIANVANPSESAVRATLTEVVKKTLLHLAKNALLVTKG